MVTAEQVFVGREARVPPGPWDVIVVGAGTTAYPQRSFSRIVIGRACW